MNTILFNAYDIILFVIIYASLLFAIFALVVKREPDDRILTAHTWLALFLLCQAGISAYVLALYGAGFHNWSRLNTPNIFVLLEIFFWLEGPLLLLYTRTALYQSIRFQIRDSILLAPLLIYLITIIIIFFMLDNSSEPPFLTFLQSDNIQYYEHVRNLTRAGFGIWALVIIRKYQKCIPHAYSNLELLTYNWLKVLVIGYIVLRFWSTFYLLLFTLTKIVFGETGINNINFNLLGISSNIGQLFLLSLLLFFGLSDSRYVRRLTLEKFEEIDQNKIDTQPTAINEARPTYTQEQVQRLIRHMASTRPYLNNQLKIDELAHQVSIAPKSLSNLINREFDMNFFEYINSYRLKEVQAYLALPELEDQSIIELAFRAGYNSKTSFNRQFKIETGKTPSEYRKSVLSYLKT